MSTTQTPTAAVPEASGREYGFSVLLSGLARMWRATVPALIVIVVNALVQGLLIGSNPQVGWTMAFILPLVASVVMFLITGAVLSACAYEAVTGRVPVAAAFGRANRRTSCGTACGSSCRGSW